MNNKSTILGIEVYDSFDNKFSPEQQKIIPLKLNESFYGLDYSFSQNKTYINITGLVPGLYPIIIKDDRSEILSNIATIEVFEKLNIYPPYLLLVPGSEYTLEITGGPKNKENVIIKYEMLDQQIANVSDNYPKVYGAKYGETKLIISLIYKYDYDKIFNINDDKRIINKTDTLCVETVPVRVDFPHSVVIIGAENNRKIYSKSTIRLLAALKKGNEVFTYGTGPFKFNWKVDNNMVAKIKYFMRKELYQKDQNNKEEIDQNCEECESLSLIATNNDHNPEKSIGVFLGIPMEIKAYKGFALPMEAISLTFTSIAFCPICLAVAHSFLKCIFSINISVVTIYFESLCGLKEKQSSPISKYIL
jgi:hypothetical protein